MKKKKEIINLNYRLNQVFFKKGKLSKIDFLMDKVYFLLAKKTEKNAFKIINQAIINIKPIFLLTNKKIGKRVIIKPFLILSDYSRKSIGLKWILQTALKKKGNLYENLYLEFLDAFYDKGIVKKRQLDLYESVLENRSNIKYRW